MEGAVAGILDLCDIVTVSGESVSMVSEAIHSGKKVVVFRLSRNSDVVTKHERALKSLADEGYITVTDPDNLENALEKAWNDTTSVKPVKDMNRIFEALRRLI